MRKYFEAVSKEELMAKRESEHNAHLERLQHELKEELMKKRESEQTAHLKQQQLNLPAPSSSEGHGSSEEEEDEQEEEYEQEEEELEEKDALELCDTTIAGCGWWLLVPSLCCSPQFT
jgi:hypothetical protein